MPLLNLIRKLSLRSKSSSTSTVADAEALVNRLSSVLARATKARFPPLSLSSSNNPSPAAAVFIQSGVDVASQLRLFNEVCVSVRTAPTVQFVDNCVFIVNSVLRTMRDDSPALPSSPGGSNNASLQQPSPSILKSLVAGFQGVLEGYLCDKTSTKNSVGSLSFFRNIFSSFPTLSVRLLPIVASAINEGKISKSFRLGEAFSSMTTIVQQCSSSWAADLVCDVRNSQASAKKSGKASTSATLDVPSLRTVRQVLRSSAPALFTAIASTLNQIKKQEHDGKNSESKGNGAVLSLKNAREPLDLAKALIKANLLRSDGQSAMSSSEKGGPLSNEAQSMLSSVAATSQVAKESVQQQCRGILKDAGVDFEESQSSMIDEEKAENIQAEEAESATDMATDTQVEKKKRKKVKT